MQRFDLLGPLPAACSTTVLEASAGTGKTFALAGLVTRYLAESAMLDPERPDDLLRPFARGGLFRKGGLLARLRDRVKRKVKGRLKR